MLRISTKRRAATAGDKTHKTRLVRRSAWLGLAIAVGSSGVMAETLAQPASGGKALEKTAAHYIAYRKDVAAIEGKPIKSADATRFAHKRLAAHDPDELAAGWVAFAALVAADTPEFAEALQKEVGDGKKRRRRGKLVGRDAFFAKLSQDPSYPRKLEGAQAAIARVLAMTAQDARRFDTLGEQFKTQAYAMQKTKWGKKRIAPGSKRLSEAKQFEAARPPATPPEFEPSTDKGVTAPMLANVNENWAHDWGQDNASGRMSEPNAQVIMDRVLNLAARYAVGGMNAKVVSVYSKNNKSQQCLSLSKLTLTQCIAATRTPYEEAFCLGEHGLKDISGCIGWVASAGAS